MSRHLLGAMLALATSISTLGACASDNCTPQSCADWGGNANRTLYACYSSGSGSIDDEFWIEDEDGNEVYKCTRPADDNDGCGVELIVAKESYCAASGSGSGGTGGGSAAGPQSTPDEEPTIAHE